MTSNSPVTRLKWVKIDYEVRETKYKKADSVECRDLPQIRGLHRLGGPLGRKTWRAYLNWLVDCTHNIQVLVIYSKNLVGTGE